MDATDRRVLELLRSGASATEAAERVGLSAGDAARRLKTLRERLGVTSTRRLLEVLGPEGSDQG